MASLEVNLALEVLIAAPPGRVWESLTRGVGTWFQNPDPGNPLHLRLEPRVGGRLYRDLSGTLGEGAGHLWGHVQVYKPPTLLEIVGPWALSDAQVTHVAFRLTGESGGTKVSLSHRATGHVPEELASLAEPGWRRVMEGLKAHAER